MINGSGDEPKEELELPCLMKPSKELINGSDDEPEEELELSPPMKQSGDEPKEEFSENFTEKSPKGFLWIIL